MSLKKFHGNIICLQETHVKQENFITINTNILPGWTCFSNYEHAPLGSIWVFHDSNIRMEKFLASVQAIHSFLLLGS